MVSTGSHSDPMANGKATVVAAATCDDTTVRRSNRNRQKTTVAAAATATCDDTTVRHSNRIRQKPKFLLNEQVSTRSQPSRKKPSKVALRGAPAGAGTKANKGEDSSSSTRIAKAIAEAEALLLEVQQETEALIIEAQAQAKPLPENFQRMLDAAKRSGRVRPSDPEATAMMRLTGSSLSKKSARKSAYDRSHRPSLSNGAFGGWPSSSSDDTVLNKRGKRVLRNESMVATVRWDYLVKSNVGMAKRHKELSHQLMTAIPARAAQLPHIFSIGDDGEYFEICQVPDSWNKEENFHDVTAKLFGFPNKNRFAEHCTHQTCEMKGMKPQRVLDGAILPRNGKGIPKVDWSRAGYRFTFKDDTDLRFDVNQSGDNDQKMPAAKKPKSN